jgi:formylglycine-generating enzyme required for sulfatase activity
VLRRLLALLTLLLAAGSAAGQAPPTESGESWAVVIGINAYQNERVPRLRYAVNDAHSVASALLRLGFKPDRIVMLTDSEATKTRIETLLGDELRQRIGPADRLLVFFAGHGLTDRLRSGEEEGYLLPVDGDPGRLFGSAISMTALRQISDRLRARHILYVVDACYSGYALYNRSIATDLLDEMLRKPAIQILTAGRQGDEAQEKGGHGVFTDVLLRGLAGEAFGGGKGWLALDELGVWLKQRVYTESNRKQLPQYGNLSGEGQFVFMRAGGAVGLLSVRSRVAGVTLFAGSQRLGTLQDSEPVVSELPPGIYRLRAEKRGHRTWEREVRIPEYQRVEVTIDIEPLSGEPRTSLTGEDGAEMVLVPAGPFWMGSTEAEVAAALKFCGTSTTGACGGGDLAQRGLPRRRVTLDAFHIDRYEVTNALFARFVTATTHRTNAEIAGSSWFWALRDKGWGVEPISNATWRSVDSKSAPPPDDHPVVHVSWFDATAYCRWAGKRLPTEAEWEKAARGEEGREFPWGEQWAKNRANIANTVGGTTAVGQYPMGASPYGVLDMTGNVWEWVNDWYDVEYYKTGVAKNPPGPATGSLRVTRGGGWFAPPIMSRASARWRGNPGLANNNLGFRCARSLP